MPASSSPLTTFSPVTASVARTIGSASLARPCTKPRFANNPRGTSLATSHIAQFQKKGSVPKRALADLTPKILYADCTSGRL